MTEDEIITRASRLPDRFAGRIPDDVLVGLRLMDDGGEYGELVGELTAALAVNHTPVSAAERDELRVLADATGEGIDYVGQLVVSE
ncbi:MAG TPA: hypothetical protein VF053_22170 [Streptosporangiales bacterium]